MKKINSIKQGGKLVILPEGAEKYLKGRISSPKFSSWNGYDKLTYQLAESWSISATKARLCLILNEKVDLKVVDDLSNNDIEKIMKYITPFKEGMYLFPEWVEQGYWRTRSFSQHKVMKFWNDRIPGISWSLINFLEKEKYFNLEVAKDILIGKTSWVRTPDDFLKLVFGSLDISPFLDKGYILYSLVMVELSIPGVLKKLNIKYMDKRAELYVDQLLKGGAKPSEIFPKLTKAEANKVASVATSSKYGNFTHDDLFVQLSIILPKVNAPWIYSYSNSVKVAKWAIAHFDQLDKVREYTTHGGEKMTIHVHRMLDHVRDHHLPRGEKTGFHYVQEQLKQIIESEIKEMLKEDQPLPEFPLDIESKDDRIWQILSSHKLRDEGEYMQHCVGSYIKMALRGTCWIFHVDLDGKPKGATVEVKDRGNGDYFINQSMLPGNVHCQEAADLVMAAISKCQDDK